MSDGPFLEAMSLRDTPDDPLPTGWPYDLPAVRTLDRLRFHPAVTFLVGENGSGKSTIMEAIAGAWGMNPEGGSRNHRFSTYASHSDLADRLVLRKSALRGAPNGYFLRAESFYNVASQQEEMRRLVPFAEPNYHRMSHGESFLALVENRFSSTGLYLLDEPESALSPDRQLRLMVEMHRLAAEGAQWIVATHSPILTAYPHSRLYTLDADGIAESEWSRTDGVRTTRAFLAHTDRMLAAMGLADPPGTR